MSEFGVALLGAAIILAIDRAVDGRWAFAFVYALFANVIAIVLYASP